MTDTTFTATVRHEGTASIIDLYGIINRNSDEALHTAYSQAVQSERVILNFMGVEFMNSTGIAVIVSLLARARAAKQALLVFGLSDHYQHIFEITRLSDLMSVMPDEASALNYTNQTDS